MYVMVIIGAVGVMMSVWALMKASSKADKELEGFFNDRGTER